MGKIPDMFSKEFRLEVLKIRRSRTAVYAVENIVF